MMRWPTLRTTAYAVLVLLATACGKSSGPQAGETNWLSCQVDADCDSYLAGSRCDDSGYCVTAGGMRVGLPKVSAGNEYPPDPEPIRVEGSRVEQQTVPSGECPESPPADSDDCLRPGQSCRYGDDPRVECRANAECDGADNTWAVPDECIDPPPGFCPEQKPVPGSSCEVPPGTPTGPSVFSVNLAGPSVTCLYGADSRCDCYSNCRYASNNGFDCDEWVCVDPPEDLDCPGTPPNSGSACSQSIQGKICAYGIWCSPSGIQMTCRNEVWEPTIGLGCRA